MLLQEHILTLLREDRERGAELLLETYTPLLWSVCRRRLSDPEDIKECVNDVFTGFCMNIDAFDPEQSSLKNYLALLADRKAISYFRNNQRRNQAETAAALAAPSDQAGLHRELEEALSLLEPEDAHILRMKYYGGMTYREIAEQMGLAEETVKKRGRRSLKKMAKWMILGLVTAALLAGCAYVAHRYFRYFRGVGIIPDENLPVYQMADAPESISANGITVHPINLSYSGEELVITLAFLPDEANTPIDYDRSRLLAEGYTISVNGHNANGPGISSDTISQRHVTIPRSELSADESGQIMIRLELIPKISTAEQLEKQHNFSMDMTVLSWDIVLEETEAIQDLTELGCYLETTYADFLVLTDWEISTETNDTYTLISLCPLYKQEGLTLSDLISTCYYPLNGRKQVYVELIDAAGNRYSPYRTGRPAPESGATEFTLWFKNLPAGEYTLYFPNLCYRYAESNQVLSLALPHTDGELLPGDCTVTLQGGSALSISGVTCQSERTSAMFMTEYWVDGVQNWVPEEDEITIRHYTVEYDLTGSETFPLWGLSFSNTFCYETESGISPIPEISGMLQDVGSLEHLSFGARDALDMAAPDFVCLTIYESYYADPSSYSLPITIK